MCMKWTHQSALETAWRSPVSTLTKEQQPLYWEHTATLTHQRVLLSHCGTCFEWLSSLTPLFRPRGFGFHTEAFSIRLIFRSINPLQVRISLSKTTFPFVYLIFILDCLPGWDSYNGNCYSLIQTDALTWMEAELHCRKQGAHLASILSQIEMNFIHDLLVRNQVFNTGTYIGMFFILSLCKIKKTFSRPNRCWRGRHLAVGGQWPTGYLFLLGGGSRHIFWAWWII